MSFTMGQAWGLQSAATLAPLPTPTDPYPPKDDDALIALSWTDPEAYCHIMSSRILEDGFPLPADKDLRAWLETHATTVTKDTDVPEDLHERYRD